MQCLVLDVDALAHGAGLGLLQILEAFISTLPGKAYIERSVYTEAVRTGVSKHLDPWQQKGLLQGPLDYRKIANGDEEFRNGLRRWRGLSKQDRASLVLAQSLDGSGILTCEKPLTMAATEAGVWAMDLFDVVRVGIRIGQLTTEAARRTCQPWDRDAFSAGRPNGYKGTFDGEWEHRKTTKPLP